MAGRKRSGCGWRKTPVACCRIRDRLPNTGVMSGIVPRSHRRVMRASIVSAVVFGAVVIMAASLTTRPARAQGVIFGFGKVKIGPALTVSIISPANGGGAPGQTLQAGVFALTNNLDVPLTINSVTIAFSRPSLFSSATLKPLSPNGASSQHDVNVSPPGFPTASPPVASTTFNFDFPVIIGPGSQPAFALEVKLSPLSRNEPGNAAYAAVTPGPLVRSASAPLWIAFAILGLTTAALSEGTQRRAWLIAGLLVMFAIGAPGCGGDSNSGPSSTQTVTVVAATLESSIPVNARSLPPEVAGLPLKIGTIFGQ